MHISNPVRQTFTSIVLELSANHRLARVILTPSSCCRSVAIADARTDTRLLLSTEGQGRRQWMSRHFIASSQTAYAFVSSCFSVLPCCIHPSYFARCILPNREQLLCSTLRTPMVGCPGKTCTATRVKKSVEGVFSSRRDGEVLRPGLKSSRRYSEATWVMQLQHV
jgi:hypothetical protein